VFLKRPHPRLLGLQVFNLFDEDGSGSLDAEVNPAAQNSHPFATPKTLGGSGGYSIQMFNEVFFLFKKYT